MKKSILSMAVVLLTACTSNDPFGGAGGGGIGDNTSGTSTGIMDLGTLSTFDVAVDTTALSETENIPQNETDAYWAQYVENNFTPQFTTIITYAGGVPNVTGVTSGDTVTIQDGNVEVRAHSKGMILEITGTTTSGGVKVYSDKKFELHLTNAHITNPTGAAINIQDGKCFVVVDNDNSLSDSSQSTYTTTNDEDEKAVFFSEDDLRLSGHGSLTINACNTLGKNAITSDDDIFIRPGCRVLINASTAAGNGIKSKGDIIMQGGVVNVTTSAAGSKALKSESDIEVNGGRLTAITTGGVDTSDSSDPSGCAALKADSIINITGGTLNLKSTGQGGKGISSDMAVNISGGATRIVTTGSRYGSSSSNNPGGIGGGGNRPGQSGNWGNGQSTQSSGSVSPKGIRSDGNITISGGEIYVRTSGSNGEGIESKATLTLAGGSTAVSAYDDGMNAVTIKVTGGRSFAISTGQCDGVDSNGTLNATGGLLMGVASTLESEDGLDCESTISCTGGTMIGFSRGGMSQSARISGRYFTSSVSGNAGEYVALCNGETPISVFALPRTYSNSKLLYITGALSSGTYSLVTGTTPSGGTLWMNIYEGATSIDGGNTSSVSL